MQSKDSSQAVQSSAAIPATLSHLQSYERVRIVLKLVIAALGAVVIAFIVHAHLGLMQVNAPVKRRPADQPITRADTGGARVRS
jgi:hypothetical protein